MRGLVNYLAVFLEMRLSQKLQPQRESAKPAQPAAYYDGDIHSG